MDRFTYAHYLYSRDLSKFNPRKCVLTSALAEQKRLSAEPFMKYVLDKIDNGFTFVVEEEKANDFGTRTIKVRKQLTKINKIIFHEDYQKVTPHPLQLNPFIKRWKKIFPNSHGYGDGSKHKDWIYFPSLEKCKEIINKEFRQDMFEEDEEEIEENSELDNFQNDELEDIPDFDNIPDV